MKEKDNFALVPRTPSSLKKAEPGAKGILSGMVADTLALAKAGFRFDDHELCEPGSRERGEITLGRRTAGVRRIVMVDDDPDLSDMYQEIIQASFKDVEVVCFQDGHGAWQELLRAPPDLLTTDLHRPSRWLPAFEMFPLLAKMNVRYPIMILSAENDPVILKCFREFARLGLNVTHFSKPASEEETRLFLGEVSRLIGASAPDHAP